MSKKFMSRLFNLIFHSRLLFVFSLTVIFYGLFLVPDSDGQGSRAWDEIWNLGHVGAFLITWTFVFNLFPRFTRLSTLRLLVVVLVTTVAVGEVIEIVQGWIGRDDELQDVWDSGVGALLAVAFCSPQINALTRWARASWRALALIALLVVPWPVWSNLADVVFIKREFPVLSDFSTPFELTRWRGNRAGIEIEKAAGQRQAFLAVEFRPGLYSTVTLKYFQRDWHAYKRLVLDVTNPEKQAYRVILRIHDRWHKRHHFALSDRFNRTLELKPGHQRIVIDLADVAKAPKTRKMDMAHLEELDLFTMASRVYHHLYIQRIFLE
jgi:hypothetical protein